MDAKTLRESLTLDEINTLLIKLNGQELAPKGDDLITNTICHNSEEGSLKLYYYEDSHRFHCYSKCHSLDIFSLVQKRFALKGLNYTLPEAIDWVINNKGGFTFGNFSSNSGYNEELSYLNKFIKTDSNEVVYDYYGEQLLDVFSHHNNHIAFLNDNISSKSMDSFDIKFDTVNNALIIPHRHWENGKIIGAMNRNFNEYALENGYKYIPTKIQNKILRFPKHANFYGLWQNKDTISELSKVAIFESEKSVLQCESYFGSNNNFSIALGGKHLTEKHIEILLKIGVKEIILCYDKDFKDIKSDEAKESITFMFDTAKRIAPYFTTYLVIDNIDLLEYKDSPSDKGKETLIKMLKNKKEIKT